MVDQAYVKQCKEEEAEEWCKGLHPNPTYTPTTKSCLLDQVRSRPEWVDVRGQQATWSDCIVLDDDSVPTKSAMMEQLARWEAEDRRRALAISSGM